MESKEFGIQYEKLCFAFDKEVKQGQLLVYYEYLRKYPIKAFQVAVDTSILSAKYFPKIGELVDIMRNYKEIIPPERQLSEGVLKPEEAMKYIKEVKEQLDNSDKDFLKQCDVLPF
jgi:hypothetical protein